MYYLKVLYFFSFLGFVMESNVYKLSNSNRHSGIFKGPITMVYGFGALALVLLDKYLFSTMNFFMFFSFIMIFIVCAIVLTFIEWLGGNILNKTLGIDMWDYSNKPYHYGKYVCLDLALTWGLMGAIYIVFLKGFFDGFINLIPNGLIVFVVILNIIDTLFIFGKKVFKFE